MITKLKKFIPTEEGIMGELDKWNAWVMELVELMRTKYNNAFGDIERDQIDLEAWEEQYYNEGLTPEEAILEDLQA